MSDILWQPGTKRIGKSRMEAFRRFVNQRHALEIADYPALHQWSIDQTRKLSGRPSSISSTSVFTISQTRC